MPKGAKQKATKAEIRVPQRTSYECHRGRDKGVTMDEIKALRERDEGVAMDEKRVPKGERSVCWIPNGSRRNNEATRQEARILRTQQIW